MWRPVTAWERGRDPATVSRRGRARDPAARVHPPGPQYPFLLRYLPFIAFTTWYLHIAWWGFFVIAAAGTVVLACSLIVRYFTIEVVSRPVLERLAEDLPPDFQIDAPGLPLRGRLLSVAPVINVITGVVVARASRPTATARRCPTSGSRG